jgi:hypothetical protein
LTWVRPFCLLEIFLNIGITIVFLPVDVLGLLSVIESLYKGLKRGLPSVITPPLLGFPKPLIKVSKYKPYPL